MKEFELDFEKYGLSYLESKPIEEYSDDEIRKLTDAFATEIIAPTVPGIMFSLDNIRWLHGLWKCDKCGRCCRFDESVPEDPGVMVFNHELERISKKTRHSLQSLTKVIRINEDPTYEVGAKYLPRTCMFFDGNARRCKICGFRPVVCEYYPVLNSVSGRGVAVDLQCDYGKGIFRQALKYIREKEKESDNSRGAKSEH